MHPKQNLLRLPIRICACLFIAASLLAAHPSSAATLEVATTYASLNPQEKPSIVSVRFKMSEVDEMATKLTPAAKK